MIESKTLEEVLVCSLAHFLVEESIFEDVELCIVDLFHYVSTKRTHLLMIGLAMSYMEPVFSSCLNCSVPTDIILFIFCTTLVDLSFQFSSALDLSI